MRILYKLRWVGLVLALSLSASPGRAQEPRAKPSQPLMPAVPFGEPSQPRDLQMHVETRLAMVKGGEPVQVRITMRNISGHTITYPRGPIGLTVGLRITDACGHAVKAVGLPVFGIVGGAVPILPGQEVTFSSGRGEEWVDLREWGYELRTVGSYTITVPGGASANGASVAITN
jgi:hypothetical protein